MHGNGETGNEETFWGDKYVYYFDCDEGSYVYFWSKFINFKHMQFIVHQFYLNKGVQNFSHCIL